MRLTPVRVVGSAYAAASVLLLPIRAHRSIRSLIIIPLCFVWHLGRSQSQWTTATNGTDIYYNTGKVGIGITQPTASLQIADAGTSSLRVGVTSNMANTYVQFLNSLAVLGNNSTSISSVGAAAWNYYNNGSSPTWAGTQLLHTGTAVTGNYCGAPASNQGTLLFQNISSGVIATNGAPIYITPGGSTVSASFLANGNVGIGTSNPGTNKLAVEGTIAARKVIVTLSNPFPDYVFKPYYPLPSLDSISKFIKINHHLPEIPSADSIAKTGLDLGNNQALLLKKIEELTLYIIDQDKNIKDQNQRLEEQNRLLEIQTGKLQEQINVLQIRWKQAVRIKKL